MLEGVAYLVEGVTLPPYALPFGELSSENLDHAGRTTTAPIASLPPWRCCLGSSCRWWSPALFGEDPLLCLHSLSFLYITQVALVVSWWMLCRPSLRWRILCRRTALADALPPLSFGWSSLRMDVLPSLLIDRVNALPPCLC